MLGYLLQAFRHQQPIGTDLYSIAQTPDVLVTIELALGTETSMTLSTLGALMSDVLIVAFRRYG